MWRGALARAVYVGLLSEPPGGIHEDADSGRSRRRRGDQCDPGGNSRDLLSVTAVTGAAMKLRDHFREAELLWATAIVFGSVALATSVAAAVRYGCSFSVLSRGRPDSPYHGLQELAQNGQRNGLRYPMP